MKKKKFGSWKFSEGGGALFIILLFSPIMVTIVKAIFGVDLLLSFSIISLSFVLIAILVWFIGIRPILKKKLWKLSRTWYEGLFGIGTIFVFYALFVFISGHTPSKYHSIAIDRSYYLNYLAYAVIPITLGLIVLVLEKYYKIGKKERG